MKRSFLILFAGVVVVGLILFFRPKPPVVNESVKSGSISTNTVIALEETSGFPTTTITQAVIQKTSTNIAPPEQKRLLDAVKAQSLADWTNAIPNIKQWSQFRGRSSWVAVPMHTNNYPVVLLTGVNGGTIQFTAKLTSVDAMDNHIREIELHTPDMSIGETRKFGESLLEMMGKDKSGFDAWCVKVGNNWVDAPLYSSEISQVPNSNQFYGFQMLRSYGNEKPWVINFIITDK